MTAKTGHLYRFRTFFESPIAVVISAHHQKLAKSYRSCFDIFWVTKTRVLLGGKKNKKKAIQTTKSRHFVAQISIRISFFLLLFFWSVYFSTFCVVSDLELGQWLCPGTPFLTPFPHCDQAKKWREIGPNNLCRLSLVPLRTTTPGSQSLLN